MFESNPIISTKSLTYQEAFYLLYLVISLLIVIVVYSSSKIFEVMSNMDYFKDRTEIRNPSSTLPVTNLNHGRTLSVLSMQKDLLN